MTDPLSVAILTGAELAKAALQLYFSNARQAGLTPEQIDKLYNETKAEMDKRPSSELKEV